MDSGLSKSSSSSITGYGTLPDNVANNASIETHIQKHTHTDTVVCYKMYQAALSWKPLAEIPSSLHFRSVRKTEDDTGAIVVRKNHF